MDINLIIGIAIIATIAFSALIVWSRGDTKRHNQRQALKRRTAYHSSAKKEE